MAEGNFRNHPKYSYIPTMKEMLDFSPFKHTPGLSFQMKKKINMRCRSSTMCACCTALIESIPPLLNLNGGEKIDCAPAVIKT